MSISQHENVLQLATGCTYSVESLGRSVCQRSRDNPQEPRKMLLIKGHADPQKGILNVDFLFIDTLEEIYQTIIEWLSTKWLLALLMMDHQIETKTDEDEWKINFYGQSWGLYIKIYNAESSDRNHLTTHIEDLITGLLNKTHK